MHKQECFTLPLPLLHRMDSEPIYLWHHCHSCNSVNIHIESNTTYLLRQKMPLPYCVNRRLRYFHMVAAAVAAFFCIFLPQQAESVHMAWLRLPYFCMMPLLLLQLLPHSVNDNVQCNPIVTAKKQPQPQPYCVNRPLQLGYV